MTESLTQKLASRIENSRDLILTSNDEGKRRTLLLRICDDVIMHCDPMVAQNITNLVHDYYRSVSQIDLDWLIGFLRTNTKIDYEINKREEALDFDRQFSTNTGMILRQFELPEIVPLKRLIDSGRCAPSPLASVKMALKRLAKYGIVYEKFVFIDIGAGLGRNLLLAADHAFQKIVGVEHSQHLCNITTDNIAAYCSKRKIASSLFSVECTDALEYYLPKENLVLYFWRPFSDNTAEKFVKKIEKFLEIESHDVFLVFLGLVYPAVKNSCALECLDMFLTEDLIDEDNYYSISVYCRKGQ